MADIGGSVADHYLLFNVCEILSIHMSGCKDVGLQSKRKDCKESRVMLRVGILKRYVACRGGWKCTYSLDTLCHSCMCLSSSEPYNPELSKPFVKVVDISSYQVKRRVVAISKEHYSQLKYKDESIFSLEDELPNTSD